MKENVGKYIRSLVVAATLFAPLEGIAFAAKGDGPEPTPQSGEGRVGWFNQNIEPITFIQCIGCGFVDSGTVVTGGRCYDIVNSVLEFSYTGHLVMNGYVAKEKSCGGRDTEFIRRQGGRVR
jgi:hypothetical protein